MSSFKMTPEHAEIMNGLCLVPVHLHPFIMPWLQHGSGVRHEIGLPMTASPNIRLHLTLPPYGIEEFRDDDNSPVSSG